jgi:hypothetical protein
MKTLFVAVMLLCISSGYSGELYGTISDEASQPLRGVIVLVRSADNETEVARDTTSNTGAYRLFVKKPGPCKVVVLRDKAEVIGDAVVYPNPVRYNWIVEKKDDSLILRRSQ